MKRAVAGGRFRLVVGRGPEQRHDAELVRRHVYEEEEQLVSAQASSARCEADPHDFSERATRLVVYTGSEPIGTVTLTLARAHGADESRRFGFDLESTFILSGFELQGIVPAEVTRFCVLRRYRGTRVASLLYSGLLAESARLGVTHLVGEANMETDCAADAALAYGLVRERQWTDSQFSAALRRDASPPAKPTRFVYTEEQRCRLRAGGRTTDDPPRVLTLFAQSMRARYIGPPAFEPAFNVFALPLVASLMD